MIQGSPLLFIFLVIYGLRSLFLTILNRLNIAYLRHHGHEVPRVFLDTVDQGKLAQMSAYAVDLAGLSLVTSLFSQGLFLLVLLSGVLPWFAHEISALTQNPVATGLIFLGVLSVLLNLPNVAFDLYETFVIEDRYGFNTQTLRIWFSDLIKGVTISAVLGVILLSVLLLLISKTPRIWWALAWLALGALELLLLWLYPVVIAPWFNKFEPIARQELENRIHQLVKGADFSIKGVFQVDAGKRSHHTNAYFAGIGRTKRVVLFDTLLASHRDDEILAILAHELGHYRKQHILKQLMAIEVLSFLGLFVASKLLGSPLLYHTFGFHHPMSYLGLFLVGTLMDLAGFFFRPFGSALSRKFEREADDAVLDLMGTAVPFVRALKRLAVDNLANLNPHPLYARFHYSHPPLVERIERLDRLENEKGVRPGHG